MPQRQPPPAEPPPAFDGDDAARRATAGQTERVAGYPKRRLPPAPAKAPPSDDLETTLLSPAELEETPPSAHLPEQPFPGQHRRAQRTLPGIGASPPVVASSLPERAPAGHNQAPAPSMAPSGSHVDLKIGDFRARLGEKSLAFVGRWILPLFLGAGGGGLARKLFPDAPPPPVACPDVAPEKRVGLCVSIGQAQDAANEAAGVAADGRAKATRALRRLDSLEPAVPKIEGLRPEGQEKPVMK